MVVVVVKVLKPPVLYTLNIPPPALGDFMQVVKKADTGMLTMNVDFPKMDELNCNVAPKVGTACRN